MANKTPFEIRSDILSLATHHLQQQYYANLEFSKQIVEKALEQTVFSNSYMTTEQLAAWTKDMHDKLMPLMPVMPDIEEILKKSGEMYGFVSKKE